MIGARGRHLKIVKPIDRDAPRRWLNDHRRPSLSMAAARAIPAIAARGISNCGFFAAEVAVARRAIDTRRSHDDKRLVPSMSGRAWLQGSRRSGLLKLATGD